MTNLVDKVPASIFSIDDFRDFRIEHDMPELTYDEYKPLRAAEYCETHAVDLDDDAQEAMADELVAQADADLEAAVAEADEPKPEPVKVEKPVKRVAKKAPVKKKVAKRSSSKKAQTVKIYGEVVAAGGGRKEGIARLTTELGLSAAGASTYWQNVKSGKWS